MHGLFPAHVDDAGMVSKDLSKGDGYGCEIASYVLRGPSVWVYVSGKTLQGAQIGLKFLVLQAPGF